MDEKKDSLAGTPIKAVPNEEVNIGIDTKNDFATNIVNAAINETLNLTDLENFLSVSQSREQVYRLIDIMMQDGTVSSIIENYVSDATEKNANGDIVWIETENADIKKYLTFLIKQLQVNKNAYGWMHSIATYGDVYLQTFKESEFNDDELFDVDEIKKKEYLTEANIKTEGEQLVESANLEESAKLQEDVVLNLQPQNEHFVNFVEKVPNPGEMYELTKKGKSVGYIKTPYNVLSVYSVDSYEQRTRSDLYNYRVNRENVELYSATNFVHGYLYDDSGRTPEKIDIFKNDEDYESGNNAHSYDVKRGKSMLYNWFKSWREMTLLENAIMLTRLTKSSLVRIIQVEVGDMPKEMIANHLQGIKAMMEQKSSIDTGNSMSNYTNPGPIENNIYVPTHGGIGNISVSAVGGDYDPKQLTDLEYFRDRFFSATGIPKAYVGFTDDQTGFNGGTSLTIISAEYARRVKRLQQAFISMITDLLNIFLFDRGLYSYINNFKVMMQPPITKSDQDLKEAQTNALGVLRDTMDVLSDIERKSTRLKIIKSLLQNITSDPEVIEYVQDEIDYIEEQEKKGEENNSNNGNKPSATRSSGGESRSSALDAIGSELGFESEPQEEGSNEETTTTTQSQETTTSEEPSGSDDYLPSFNELGVDSNDVNV